MPLLFARPAKPQLPVCSSVLVARRFVLLWVLANLLAAQGSTTDSTSGTSPASSTGTESSSSNTKTGDAETTDATKTGKSTDSETKGTSKPTHTEFAPDSPVGGVQILTPATNAEPTVLFKIKDQVTLGWNYTSLQGTPTAIDVLISCQVASATWTLTQNMTFSTSVSYVWDTKKQSENVESPLPVEMYTLIIKDSDAAITDPPEAGYLGAYSGFKFGLYTPQPYTPYPEWICPGCSDAPSQFGHHALGMAVAMSVVTFLSFTWFVSGLGLH